MARPKVFISSTYFDLKSIREELDRFVTSIGYEPIRHEMGHISYGRDEPPENYAYKEVEYSDILISIIGSKFGTTSNQGIYSISQAELRKAYDENKQVYIFIDEAVHSEYKFYLANKHLNDITYTAVTDKRIFGFIEEIYQLKHGNPIFSFRTGLDIVTMLRDQWAGLFQRLLSQEKLRSQTALTEQLQQSLQTVSDLVNYLQKNNLDDRAVLQQIIFNNHPAFTRLREAIKNKYRLFFTNLQELSEWAVGARSFERIAELDGDSDYIWMREYQVGLRTKNQGTRYQTLLVDKCIFGENSELKSFSQNEWNDDWIRVITSEQKPDRFLVDDDIPF